MTEDFKRTLFREKWCSITLLLIHTPCSRAWKFVSADKPAHACIIFCGTKIQSISHDRVHNAFSQPLVPHSPSQQAAQTKQVLMGTNKTNKRPLRIPLCNTLRRTLRGFRLGRFSANEDQTLLGRTVIADGSFLLKILIKEMKQYYAQLTPQKPK